MVNESTLCSEWPRKVHVGNRIKCVCLDNVQSAHVTRTVSTCDAKLCIRRAPGQSIHTGKFPQSWITIRWMAASCHQDRSEVSDHVTHCAARAALRRRGSTRIRPHHARSAAANFVSGHGRPRSRLAEVSRRRPLRPWSTVAPGARDRDRPNLRAKQMRVRMGSSLACPARPPPASVHFAAQSE
jgi:hypothetical protein